MAREPLLIDILVELADTLDDDFDVHEFLHRTCESCVLFLGSDAAGIMLANPGGRFQLTAAVGDRIDLIELLSRGEACGLGAQCCSNGHPPLPPQAPSTPDWHSFAAEKAPSGYAWRLCLPMHRHDATLGVLNIVCAVTDKPPAADARVAYAIADMATISLLHRQRLDHQTTLAGQLQTALDSRVVIEQAKGVIAERHALDVGAAFARIRSYARSHNLRLTEVAQRIVAGELHPPPADAPERPGSRQLEP